MREKGKRFQIRMTCHRLPTTPTTTIIITAIRKPMKVEMKKDDVPCMDDDFPLKDDCFPHLANRNGLSLSISLFLVP